MPMTPPPAQPSAKPATPVAKPKVGRRLRALGVSGRRFRRGWTRERSMEVLRTLVYVVPLTLLIWVWAQDQQIDTRIEQNIPVRVEHIDGQKIVQILQTGTGELVNRRGDNILTTLTLQGPRIGLNSVLRALREERATPALDVRLRGRSEEQATVSLREQLNNLDILREAGVSVVESTPSDLVVQVEDRRQVEARLVPENLDPGDLDGPVEFLPPRVTLSGPASAIAQLQGTEGEVVIPLELPTGLPPGEHVVDSLRVVLPEGAPASITQGGAEYVSARFTLRQRRNQELVLPFPVQVFAEVPAALSDRLRATEFNPPVLNGLRVQGPSDLIARLRDDDTALRQQIKAVISLQREDEDLVNESVTRAADVRLPEGLTLVGERPQVTFTLRRVDGL